MKVCPWLILNEVDDYKCDENKKATKQVANNLKKSGMEESRMTKEDHLADEQLRLDIEKKRHYL